MVRRAFSTTLFRAGIHRSVDYVHVYDARELPLCALIEARRQPYSAIVAVGVIAELSGSQSMMHAIEDRLGRVQDRIGVRILPTLAASPIQHGKESLGQRSVFASVCAGVACARVLACDFRARERGHLLLG